MKEKTSMRIRVLVSLALLLLSVALAGRSLSAQEPVTLTVVTHDSFAVSEALLDAFEQEYNIDVQILRSGDTGTMVNQSVLSRNNPLGDIMYGVDNTFLSRALDAELFVPYEPAALEFVPEEFVLDDQFRVVPIDFGDVCINYDKTFFQDFDLPLPDDLADLADPAYKDLLVVENPATSSPGLAFLMTTVAYFGTDTDYDYLDYWADLVVNGVLVTEDWSNAYYGYFSASSDGERPLVVSYASSPPAEVYFAEEPLEEAPTGSLIADDMCFRQIEFAGILAGTDKIDAAQRFIDFMLSLEVQEDLPLQMFVFPVREDAELPEVFADYAEVPEKPVTLDIQTIDAQREDWIQAWTEVVLR